MINEDVISYNVFNKKRTNKVGISIKRISSEERRTLFRIFLINKDKMLLDEPYNMPDDFVLNTRNTHAVFVDNNENPVCFFIVDDLVTPPSIKCSLNCTLHFMINSFDSINKKTGKSESYRVMKEYNVFRYIADYIFSVYNVLVINMILPDFMVLKPSHYKDRETRIKKGESSDVFKRLDLVLRESAGFHRLREPERIAATKNGKLVSIYRYQLSRTWFNHNKYKLPLSLASTIR